MRVLNISFVIVNLCFLYVWGLPIYPQEDDSYMQLLSAIGNMKGEPDSYLGGLYDQMYPNGADDGISYEDYMYELMREQQMNKQIAGGGMGDYYDMDEDEDGEEAMNNHIDLEVEENWPAQKLQLGQVVGVAVCREGFPHIFHRGDRVWNSENELFDKDNKYMFEQDGPIKEATLLKLSFEDGSVVSEWGENKFYLPHGLTIDNDGNTWVTDIAMHQVLKFEPGNEEPSLTLGKAFEPAENNDDEERFCKPTDIAVSSTGEIFVADGYCNSRIVKFSEDGKFIGQLGEDDFEIPHSIALAEDLDMLCVADREDRRILCYNAGINNEELFGKHEKIYQQPEMGRIFAIEYNPNTGLLHVVNGASENERAFGFTIDLNLDSYNAEVVDEWSPDNMGFDQPHDVAVSPDGNSVYVGEIGPNRIWKFENVAGNDVIAEMPMDAEEQEVEEENEVKDVVGDSLEDELEKEEEMLSQVKDEKEEEESKEEEEEVKEDGLGMVKDQAASVEDQLDDKVEEENEEVDNEDKTAEDIISEEKISEEKE